MKRARRPAFVPDPGYAAAFAEVLKRVAKALGKSLATPVKAYVAGGAALHLYTGARISRDIDAALSVRVVLDANELQVAYRGPDGHSRILYFDTQYNDTFALLHEDAYRDSIPIAVAGLDARTLEVHVLDPLDLGVSKLSRFSDQDREDIRILARAGLVDSGGLRARAESALPGYVGNLDRIRTSIDIACRDIDSLTPAAALPRKGRSRSPRTR